MQGWAKFKREWFENPVVRKDNDYLAVMVYICVNVLFEKREVLFGKDKITLDKGQLLTTHKEMYKELGIERNKLDRIIKALKSEELIKEQTNRHKTIITLLFADEYQGANEEQGEELISIKRATKQDRENEKEKSSKREKDKEKEKIKNVKNVSVCMDTQKLPYGTYENVFLTPEWYEEFCTEHSKAVANRVINRLSVYKKAKEIENVNDEPYLIEFVNQDAPKRRMPTYGDADECFEAAIARTYAEDDDEYGF